MKKDNPSIKFVFKPTHNNDFFAVIKLHECVGRSLDFMERDIFRGIIKIRKPR